MKIDDRTHEAAKAIVTEIVKERSGNIETRGLKEWYNFIVGVLTNGTVEKGVRRRGRLD